MALPLTVGAVGDAVRDLHQRLAAAGYPARAGNRYTETTADLVREFQQARGLDPSGVCDDATWNMLVEASYRLGDRSLYQTRPMLRGEDIADLQLRLGGLGFDAGRVDGIFGPQTERAVADFQRNAGLTTDGVAGPHTIAELLRLSARTDTSRPVAQVREVETLRTQQRELAGLRVAIGEDGPFHALVHAFGRVLRDRNVVVLEEHQPDWSAQARTANEFGAQVFVALAPADSDECHIQYFASTGFSSPGGRKLAELAAVHLPAALGLQTAVTGGMRLPILRETRMPAVLCRIGSPGRVAGHAPAVARALVEVLEEWVSEPTVN